MYGSDEGGIVKLVACHYWDARHWYSTQHTGACLGQKTHCREDVLLAAFSAAERILKVFGGIQSTAAFDATIRVKWTGICMAAGPA
jgi:hypothetical protein